MARPVYSLRIFASAGLVPGAGTVGPVVPAGLIYVLRDIDAFCDTAASGDNMVVFSQVGGILWDLLIPTTPEGAGFQWRGRQVYAEGEQIGFRSFQGTWSVAASGYQLTLP